MSTKVFTHTNVGLGKVQWNIIMWVFVYELSGCGFESCCSHLNFRYCACFEKGVPWQWDNYRVLIHSETRTWHAVNKRYYWCRLQARKKRLEIIWNKNPRWIPWFVCSKGNIARWCIWKLSKCLLSWNIWTCKVTFFLHQISMASSLKKEPLTNIDMLLMVEKGIRGEICHTIHQYAKTNTNTWKIMIKIKNDHILSIWT